MLQTSLETLQQWITQAQRIVFFGGAGVSTESGIADFRSTTGLYHQTYDQPPETILSHSFFMQHPDAFYRFYKERMLYLDAMPNAAHHTLAQWEAQGKLLAIVTQNIDGLHQKAGNTRVLELHGSVHRNHCMTCHKAYPPTYVLQAQGVPHCTCGGRIKPDVVLYEEALCEQTMQDAVHAIAQADVCIIGGTSLVVYPAAGLLRYYRGTRLVLINKTPTPADAKANLVLHGAIGEIFAQL